MLPPLLSPRPYQLVSDWLCLHKIDATHPVETIDWVMRRAGAVLVFDETSTGRRGSVEPPFGVVGARLRSENAAASFDAACSHGTMYRLTAKTAASRRSRRQQRLQAQ